MEQNDTVNLLRECAAGSAMAVESIDEVMEKVCDAKLKEILVESREHHEKLGNEIEEALDAHHSDEKEPGAIAKSMSWIKTNVKMSLDNSDSTVADLITDGCNMGIKSLHRFLNQYSKADELSKALCGRLAQIEEKLGKDMRAYL